MSYPTTTEHRRLADSEARRADWKHWGPYVSERAWGTVREDYSAAGDAWTFFPHDHARSRAYRWNEDGLAGFCNRFQNLCLAVALWNGRDPILKERLLRPDGPGGQSRRGRQGVLLLPRWHADPLLHADALQVPAGRVPLRPPGRGEPAAGAHRARVRADRRAGRGLPAGPLLRRVRRVCQGRSGGHPLPDHGRQPGPGGGPAARLAAPVVPQHLGVGLHPRTARAARRGGDDRAAPSTATSARRWWYLDSRPHRPALLFTENDTNTERLFGVPNAGPYVKDAFHEAVVHGRSDRVNPAQQGSKAAAHYRATVAPGEAVTVRWRFTNHPLDAPFGDFDARHRAAAQRGRRILRRGAGPGPRSRCAARAAPGVCRAAVDQAVLSLQRRAVARLATRPARRRRQPGPGDATPAGTTSTTSTS